MTHGCWRGSWPINRLTARWPVSPRRSGRWPSGWRRRRSRAARPCCVRSRRAWPDAFGLIKAICEAEPGSPAPDPDADRISHGLPIRLTRAADIRARPVEWLWQDRVPLGMLSLWAGAPKLGKSYVSLCWPPVSRAAPGAALAGPPGAGPRDPDVGRGRPGPDHHSPASRCRRRPVADPRAGIRHRAGRRRVAAQPAGRRGAPRGRGRSAGRLPADRHRPDQRRTSGAGTTTTMPRCVASSRRSRRWPSGWGWPSCW